MTPSSPNNLNPPDDELDTKSFWQLVPWRNLTFAALLLVLLVVVVLFRGRSGSIADSVGRNLFPESPRATKADGGAVRGIDP